MVESQERRGVIWIAITLIALVGGALCWVAADIGHRKRSAGPVVPKATRVQTEDEASAAGAVSTEKQQEALDRRLAEAEAKLAAAEERLAIERKAGSGLLREKLNEMRLAQEDLDAKLRTAQAVNDDRARALSAATARAEKSLGDLATAEKRVAELEARVKQFDDKAKQLQAESVRLTKDLTAARAEAAQARQAAQRTNVDLQEQLAAAQAARAAAEKTTTDLQKRCEELEAKLAAGRPPSQ